MARVDGEHVPGTGWLVDASGSITKRPVPTF